MKNIIFFLFVGIILMGSFSCCRFIPKKCITHTVDTVTIVKLDTLIIKKDTIIEIEVEVPYEVYVGDTIEIYRTSYKKWSSDTLFMKVTLAEAWAVVENNYLKGKIVQKDTLLIVNKLLEDAIREKTILKDSVTTINNNTTIIKKQFTKTKWILIAVIAILALILAIKIIKK